MKQEETGEEHSPGRIQQAVQTLGEHTKSDTTEEEPSGRDTEEREDDNITDITEEGPKEDFDSDDDQEDSKPKSLKRSKTKKSHSNIRKAIKTMATALFPKSFKGNFLSKTKPNHQNP